MRTQTAALRRRVQHRRTRNLGLDAAVAAVERASARAATGWGVAHKRVPRRLLHLHDVLTERVLRGGKCECLTLPSIGSTQEQRT